MARILKDYPQVSLEPESLKGKIDFCQIFGRCRPVHVEVGSGKATFLVNEATVRSDDNFLGIEWARRYYRYAVDRVGRRGLRNVRIVRDDITQFTTEHIPDGSIDCFHIYFPDPWPKKRHHKRRFLCAANLDQLVRCLKPCGRIQIATDHSDYFTQIQSILSAEDRLEEILFTRPAGAGEGELTGTNYERKYIKDGRTIYTIAVKKKD